MLSTRHPLRVVVFGSRRAPGIADLLADPLRGRIWELSGVLASDDDFRDGSAVEAAGVPLVLHSIRRFCARGRRPLSDLAARGDYDRESAELVEVWRPDLILLSGYLLVLTRPMLEAYPNRLVNIHGSDLTALGPCGEPRYLGLRAVEEAILAGEKETRATAHFVTAAVDLGPPILRSRAFPVSPLVEAARARRDVRMLKAYAFAHQEWMLHEAWGPLAKGLVHLVAGGRLPVGPAAVEGRPLLSISERGPLIESNVAMARSVRPTLQEAR